MPDTEIIADFPATRSYSELPAHLDTIKDKRHWVNITEVTDAVLNLEVTSTDHMILLSAATAVAGINLPPSDSASAGMSFYYYAVNVTNVVTITRDGTDTINGAASNVVPLINTTGRLTSLGNGNWAHTS